MKKKAIILSIILLLIIIFPIIISKINKKENKSYTIETYIDGKLAVSLPSSGSGYILDSITCTNGAEGKFNYSTWRVKVSNIKSNTKCIVKFISNNNSFANYLTKNQSKIGLVNENGLRYEGADVKNYVLFNDELWRIIGVFNVSTMTNTQNLVKLVRAEALDGLAWNSSNQNTWGVNASLGSTLNSGYLYAWDDSNCYVYSKNVKKTCNFSETGIKDGAREKIEIVWWNTGKSSSSSNTEAMYNSEMEAQASGYVGLMSASDYGYGVLADSCERTTDLSSYNTSECDGSNWLRNIGDEWTLTPSSKNQNYVLYIRHYGYVNDGYASYGYGFRPSVYLKSTVQYVSGTGSYFDPYIIA